MSRKGKLGLTSCFYIASTEKARVDQGFRPLSCPFLSHPTPLNDERFITIDYSGDLGTHKEKWMTRSWKAFFLCLGLGYRS